MATFRVKNTFAERGKDLLCLLFYIFIVYSMVLGAASHVIGPISFRHITTILLFVIYLFASQKALSIERRPIKYYLVYLAIYFVANIFNGEFVSDSFLRSFVTFHLPALAVALTLPVIVNSSHKVKLMTAAISLVFLVNIVLNYFQYQGNALAWKIGVIANSNGDISANRAVNHINQAGFSNLFNKTILIGLAGYVVENGYVTSIFAAVATLFVFSEKRLKRWTALLLMIISVIILFYIGQKAAFILAIAYFVGALAITSTKWQRVFVVAATILLLVFVGVNLSISEEALGKLGDEGSVHIRLKLLTEFETYLADDNNILWGGYEQYRATHEFGQHNTFLAAWTYGGFFLFLWMIFFWAALAVVVVKKMIKGVKNYHSFSHTLAYGGASMIYLIISLSHSDGVQQGSPLFWLVFTMVLISYSVEKNENVATTKISIQNEDESFNDQ